MTLDDLVGLHVIDGVGEYIADKTDRYTEDARVFLLRMDGLVYQFTENPEDGYRSMLKDIQITHDSKRIVPFAPMVCNIIRCQRRDMDLVAVVCERTGLVIAEIGTEDTDDYYPQFIARWDPNGMTPLWIVS